MRTFPPKPAPTRFTRPSASSTQPSGNFTTGPPTATPKAQVALPDGAIVAISVLCILTVSSVLFAIYYRLKLRRREGEREDRVRLSDLPCHQRFINAETDVWSLLFVNSVWSKNILQYIILFQPILAKDKSSKWKLSFLNSIQKNFSHHSYA